MRTLLITMVVVIALSSLSLLAFASNHDLNPGNLVIDKNGFKYYEWPFKFNGLTVGKPVDNLNEVGALFPGAERENKDKALKYLNKIGLRSQDIPAHQFQVWGFEPTKYEIRQIDPKYIGLYLENFLKFLGMADLSGKGFDFTIHRVGGTLTGVALYCRGSIGKPIQGLSIATLNKTLGKQDLSFKTSIDSGHSVWHHSWKNIAATTIGDKVVGIGIGHTDEVSCVGPKPAKSDDFSQGWLMPWELLLKMVKYPSKYMAVKRELEKKGISWTDNNIWAIKHYISAKRDDDLKQLRGPKDGYITGVMYDDYDGAVSALLPHLLPGKSIPATKYHYCLVDFSPPGIITNLTLMFTEDGVMSIKEFEKIYGRTKNIEKEGTSKLQLMSMYYLDRKMWATFDKDRLVAFNLQTFPIIFPRPNRSD